MTRFRSIRTRAALLGAAVACLASVGVLAGSSAPASALPPIPGVPVPVIDIPLLSTSTTISESGTTVPSDLLLEPSFLVGSKVTITATVKSFGSGLTSLGIGGGSVQFVASQGITTLVLGSAPVGSCTLTACTASLSTSTLALGTWTIFTQYTPSGISLDKPNGATSGPFSIVAPVTLNLALSVTGCTAPTFSLEIVPIADWAAGRVSLLESINGVTSFATEQAGTGNFDVSDLIPATGFPAGTVISLTASFHGDAADFFLESATQTVSATVPACHLA